MTVSYKRLDAAESELLTSGIDRVYGDTYPIPEFYDPQYIANAITEHRLHAVVAQAASGEVVASMSTILEQVGDYTADGSALMVAEEYRGQGIVANLGVTMVETYQSLGLSGLHLYALALHDLVQNQSQRAGALVTGVLPAWFSRQARVAGYDYPDARIGAVTLYLPLGPAPGRVNYLPAHYQSVLARVFERSTLDRELYPPCPDAPLPVTTSLRLEHRPGNRQTRVVITRVGRDIEETLRGLTRSADTEVLYLDIPLSDPGNDVAVQAARQLGFFFGALMVERCGGDHLRLQCYRPHLVAPKSMVLASEEAREMLDFVLEDAEG